MCKAFPTTLKGPALEWFTSILSYSIDCFETLSSLFSTQFVGIRSHPVTSLSLLNVKQEKDETFKAFIDRFSMLALKIKNLTHEFFLQYMATTLKLGPFVDNLCMNPPTIMHEVRLRVVNYIRVEEMRDLRNKMCTEDRQNEMKGVDKETIQKGGPNLESSYHLGIQDMPSLTCQGHGSSRKPCKQILYPCHGCR